MILNKFGTYLLQKRLHAVLTALLFALLPLAYLPTGSIAVVIMALITLHKGAKEGLIILVCIMLPPLAVMLWGNLPDISQQTEYAIVCIRLFALVATWLMACWLGSTASWRTTLQLIVGVSALVLLVIHAMFPDLTSWWFAHLSVPATNLLQQVGIHLTTEENRILLLRISQFMTGTALAFMIASNIILLMIARAWQADLFNPGGFAREYALLRMPLWYSSVFLIALLLIGFDIAPAIVKDCLPMLGLPFFFAAVSFVHLKLPAKKSTRMPAIITFYLLLVVFLPYMIVLLIAFGLVDSCYNFRTRFTANS